MAGETKANPQYVISANADGLQIATLAIERINVFFKGPDMPIPDGYAVVIMSHPANTLLNFINIGGVKAPGNRVIPLLPGQTLPLFIKNPISLYISGTAAGDLVLFYSERVNAVVKTPYN